MTTLWPVTKNVAVVRYFFSSRSSSGVVTGSGPSSKVRATAFRSHVPRLITGRKKLEDLFGLPVEHFAYPFGESNEAVRDLVYEAGFGTACRVHSGK